MQYLGLTHTHQLELFCGGQANQYSHYYNLGMVYSVTVGGYRKEYYVLYNTYGMFNHF